MRYLFMVLLSFASGSYLFAQYTCGLQLGTAINTAKPERGGPGDYNDYNSKTAPVFNLYVCANIDKRLNIGGTIYYTGYSVVTHTTTFGGSPSGYNRYSYDSNTSHYCFIGPLFSFIIDRHRHFAISFAPTIGFPVDGKETGYIVDKYRNDSISNSNRYVRKEVLAFEGDISYSYPVTKKLFVTADAGFIFGSSISGFADISATKFLLQLGLRYDLVFKTAKSPLR